MHMYTYIHTHTQFKIQAILIQAIELTFDEMITACISSDVLCSHIGVMSLRLMLASYDNALRKIRVVGCTLRW